MAYTKGYQYDIFISYAHLDNVKVFGRSTGWIEHFYTDLIALLSRRIGKTDTIKIWWDNRKLDGSVLFDHSIEEGIRQSAIIICLLSPAYLQSAYCRKELQLFHAKALQEPAGLELANRSRILNVLLNNIPYPEWPRELAGTTGFSFHDAKDKEDFGDLLDARKQHFRNQLQDFRDAVMRILDAFPKEAGEGPVAAPLAETPEIKPEMQKPALNEGTGQEEKFTIYFGDVSDGMRRLRKRTITELEKQGFAVVCDTPPPYTTAEHEKAVTEKLAEADLAVHLLDGLPGREIVELKDAWYPQKQVELGLQGSKSQLIWVPKELDMEAIEEEAYKGFLYGLRDIKKASAKTDFVEGLPGELTRQISDCADHLKAQRKAQQFGEKMAILLDTHYNDQLYALELSKNLLEHGIQPFINPQEDDPKKNIHVLADRIGQVSKLVFLYGQVSKDWVLGRMNEALKLIVENDYPIEDFFVFMVPPHKKPDEISMKQRFLKIQVVNNSDASRIQANNLELFLKNLRPSDG